MNGVHDLGGMHGFGPVAREEHEPVFHADWEKRVFAMMNAVLGRRIANIDAVRHAIERMPPARYLSVSYYEKWLYAIENVVVENGLATRDELANGHASSPAPVRSTGPLSGDGDDDSFDPAAVRLRFDKSIRPRFKVGDRVVTRNINPQGHTRLPRYARGKRGVVRYDHGVFTFPDTRAHGLGDKPQHLYTVDFQGKELWGKDREGRTAVYLDCWEDYLERERTPASRTAASRVAKTRTKTPAKIRTKIRTVKPAGGKGRKR
jgi:nitrile hydratase subunit beta